MKQTITTLLAVLLTAATTQAEIIDGINYELNKKPTGNTATVKQSYSVSFSGELTIPATVTYDGETYTVTTIGPRAMQDISMVTKLSLPATVTDITYNNFAWKNSLESITVDEGNPVYDSRGGCNALIETAENKLIFGCKNTVIPEGIVYFGDDAFGGTGIETVVIPRSVVSISENAFSACQKLTTVTILGSLTEGIDEEAFSSCYSLTDVYFYATTPPSLEYDAFETRWVDDVRHITDVTLHVPADAVEVFKTDASWGMFDNIVPLPDAVKGDANGDGRVNAADVAAVVSFLLDQAPGSFNSAAADMDGSGTVDLSDLKAIVVLILNQ